MQSYRINCGETIIDPFWDPQISTIDTWTLHREVAKGMTFQSNWCDAAFSYLKPGQDDQCFKISREYGKMPIEAYNFLVCSISAPVGSRVCITAKTDGGHIEKISSAFGEIKEEIYLDIQKATYLYELTLQIFSKKAGPGYGYIQWIGLENSDKLKAHLSQFEYHTSDLVPYLKAETYEPSYTMTYELMLNNDELQELRQIHDADRVSRKRSVYDTYIASYIDQEPEDYISEYVNFWTDRRFCRQRDFDKHLTQKMPTLAVAGLIKKDKKLLRKAARYAISLALCTYWNDSFMTQTQGSTWEHRAFVKSILGYELGIVLDLAGEMFTEVGRDLILRRLGEETLGATNFVTWKHDYIFHNNQLAWFSHGRMMAYAVLEHHYDHVRPYTDIAYKDLVENIEKIIYEDGGYGEGPSYMNCIGRNAMFAFYVYARLRNQKLIEVVPKGLTKTGDFIEALSSTVARQDAIPVCDGRPVFKMPTVMYMANVLPKSYWSKILDKMVERDSRIPEDLLAFYLYTQFKKQEVKTHPFLQLEDMGMIASTRELHHQPLKILIFGNKANADHAHEDKGAFVIEFCNETFAMDPGNADYASSVSYLVKLAKYHNLSIPIGDFEEEPGPERPNTCDVSVKGAGDEKRLSASVELTHTWRAYFKQYVRLFYSVSPKYLIIEDNYELIDGEGVDFGWNTMLPVFIDNHEVLIQGTCGKVRIEAEADVDIRLEELPYFDGQTQTRIGFRKKENKGKIILKCEFMVDEKEN